jgi:hypothetical protein
VAAAQWNELVDLLHNILNLGISEDSWSYIWGTSTFTPKLAYKQLQGTCVAHPLFSWLWKSCGCGKHKFFGWLLFCDRLNTREILKRKKGARRVHMCSLHIRTGGIDGTLIL